MLWINAISVIDSMSECSICWFSIILNSSPGNGKQSKEVI